MSRTIYDLIGRGYAQKRRSDPQIAAQLTDALGGARTVLNVGAGAGSYEPTDREVVAVEPSTVMLAQRPAGAAPAVQARAEALPFANHAFDAVTAILTVHHWTDRARGFTECARVARQRVVLLSWDPDADAFWLLRDYLPAFIESDRKQFPPMSSYATAFGPAARVSVTPMPVPRDCADGFLGAYWARPEAYLDTAVQMSISSFARPSQETVAGLTQLRTDLASGKWHSQHGHLLAADALDLGYRLVVVDLA